MCGLKERGAAGSVEETKGRREKGERCTVEEVDYGGEGNAGGREEEVNPSGRSCRKECQNVRLKRAAKKRAG